MKETSLVALNWSLIERTSEITFFVSERMEFKLVGGLAVVVGLVVETFGRLVVCAETAETTIKLRKGTEIFIAFSLLIVTFAFV